MVHLLQLDSEALAEKQSEGSEDRREGFYPWNAIMESSSYSAYSLRKERDEFLGIQNTLKALADPIRRKILNLLKNGRLSAGEICEHFSVTKASISRQLAILKEADLIRNKREGKFIYYELNTSVLENVMLWIIDLKGVSDDEGNDKKI